MCIDWCCAIKDLNIKLQTNIPVYIIFKSMNLNKVPSEITTQHDKLATFTPDLVFEK